MLYYLFEYLEKNFQFPGAGLFSISNLQGVIGGNIVSFYCYCLRKKNHTDFTEQTSWRDGEGSWSCGTK
jgi:hypothetical protein